MRALAAFLAIVFFLFAVSAIAHADPAHVPARTTIDPHVLALMGARLACSKVEGTTYEVCAVETKAKVSR